MVMIACPKCRQQLIRDDQEMCQDCLRLELEHKEEERRKKIAEMEGLLARCAKVVRKALQAIVNDGWDRERSRLRPKVYFWAAVLFIMIIGGGFERQPQSKNRDIVVNSSWDGSVRQVNDYLQGVLKDPSSFEAIEWSKVVKKDGVFAVRCKYRAKNSFGGYVIEEKLFIMDGSGRVTSVVDY